MVDYEHSKGRGVERDEVKRTEIINTIGECTSYVDKGNLTLQRTV